MKSVVTNIDEVAEPLRGEYVQKGTSWVLRLEGDHPDLVALRAELTGKINEFRDNNVSLMRELETARPIVKQFEGINADEAKRAISRVKELGNKGITDANDVDTRLKTMLEEAIQPLKAQLDQQTTTAQQERERANTYLLRTKITDEFVRAGGRPSAADFILGLAKETFEVKEHEVVPKTGKLSTEKPGEPISIKEWVGSLATTHDFAFAPSGGGGATPPNTRQPMIRPRDGVRIIKNPTPQELGQFATEVTEGKVKFEFDSPQQ